MKFAKTTEMKFISSLDVFCLGKNKEISLFLTQAKISLGQKMMRWGIYAQKRMMIV